MRGRDMLREKLLKLMEQLAIDSSDIVDNTNLASELSMDSQEFVELFCLIEKEFKINLPGDLIAETKTFSDLVKTVEVYMDIKNYPIKNAVNY